VQLGDIEVETVLVAEALIEREVRQEVLSNRVDASLIRRTVGIGGNAIPRPAPIALTTLRIRNTIQRGESMGDAPVRDRPAIVQVVAEAGASGAAQGRILHIGLVVRDLQGEAIIERRDGDAVVLGITRGIGDLVAEEVAARSVGLEVLGRVVDQADVRATNLFTPSLRGVQDGTIADALAFGLLGLGGGIAGAVVHQRDIARALRGLDAGVGHLILTPTPDRHEQLVEEVALPGNTLGLDLVAGLLAGSVERVDIAAIRTEDIEGLGGPANVVGGIVGLDAGGRHQATNRAVSRLVVGVGRVGVRVVVANVRGRIPSRLEVAKRLGRARGDDRGDIIQVGAGSGAEAAHVATEVGDPVNLGRTGHDVISLAGSRRKGGVRGPASVVAVIRALHILREQAGEDMVAQDTGQEGLLIEEVVEAQVAKRREAMAVAIDVVLRVAVLAAVADIGATDVRVVAAIEQLIVDIDTEDILAAVKEADLAILIALHVVHILETETITEEGLRNGEIGRIPTVVFRLVRTVHQQVVEVEDGVIRQRLVVVVSRAKHTRVTVVVTQTGDGRSLTKLDATNGAINLTGAVQAASDASDRGLGIDGSGARAIVDELHVAVGTTAHRSVAVPRSNALGPDFTIGLRLFVGRQTGPVGRRIDRQLVHVGKAGHRVGAGLEPLGNRINRRQGARAVGVDVTALVVHADGGAGVRAKQLRIEAQRTVDAARLLVGRILLEVLVFIEGRDTNRQLILDQHVVVIERRADRVVLAVAVLDLATRLEGGAVQAGIDDTGRATDAEQDRVRAALHIDAVDVVAVPRNLRHEVIPGVVRRVQTTDTGVRVRTEEGRSLNATEVGEVTTNAADFRVGRIDQQVLGVLGTSVLEELGVDNRQRGRDVLHLGTNTRASQGIFDSVTRRFIRRADRKRIELNDFLRISRILCNRLSGSGLPERFGNRSTECSSQEERGRSSESDTTRHRAFHRFLVGFG